MPTISTFFGMTVRMFFNEHPPAHFHVAYQRRRALRAETAIAIAALSDCKLFARENTELLA